MESNFYIPEKIKEIAPVIWEQKTGLPQRWKMLPEFSIDLIFNLEKPWKIYSEFYKSRSFNPTENFCFLSGLHTKPLYVEFPHCHMFGIRLNTLAANMLFGLSCKELKNWSIEGDVLSRDNFNYIQDNIRSLSDFQSRAVWLEEFIYSLVTHHSDYQMALKISSMLDKICSEGKNVRIEDLTGYSRMHTSRLFYKWFGTSPSEAISFKRFVKALNQIHYTSENLTQIGLNTGFYDQPHFIRVFKEFAEMTPKQYLKQKTNLVGQLPFDLKTF